LKERSPLKLGVNAAFAFAFAPPRVGANPVIDPRVFLPDHYCQTVSTTGIVGRIFPKSCRLLNQRSDRSTRKYCDKQRAPLVT